MWMPSQSSQAGSRSGGRTVRASGCSSRRTAGRSRRRRLGRDSGTARRARRTGGVRSRPPRSRRPGCRPGRRPGRADRLPRLHRRVADHEDLRVAGDRQVRADQTRPARSVSASVAVATDWTNDEAWTPAAHRTVRVGMRSVGPAGIRPRLTDRRCGRPGSSSGPRPRAARAGGCADRSTRRVGRQDPVHRLDEDDPGVGRVDRAEVAPERVVGDLAERARQLDPGRAAADDHERHPLGPSVADRARARPPRTR